MFPVLVTRRLIQAAAGIAMLAASAVHAQDRALFTWSGRIDKEVQITIRDTSMWTSTIGGAPSKISYIDQKDRLPRRDGFVRVVVDYGRGDVDVLEQPSAKNDYAAIIRIRDGSTGTDDYQVKAFWNPTNGEDRYSSAAIVARMAADFKPANTLRWSGTVDREMDVEWRGWGVASYNRGGETAREVHSSVSNGLPYGPSHVELTVKAGRGDVIVMQQPTSSNGYTAIFRIRDPMSGMGKYDFDVTWR